MSAQASTSAAAAVDNAKPLVLILGGSSTQLEEWLASHPPSRLGVPAALNNGALPKAIWVLAVPSVNDLAELASNATAEETFVRANELVRDATSKVSQIQNDSEIPVHHTNKAPSKKQCRTDVQNAFHDHIVALVADHPLWNQGRWTIIIRPTQIDSVFSQLAKSLASGELRKHGSIIGLRARILPFEEGTMESSKNSQKRPKTSHGRHRSSGSSKSPSSALQAQHAMLGVDIFFRPVWNSNAARNVLKLVAGVSGRMASFCKSSLYSRLGIRADHQLATHTSLFNSKTLATPAEAKLWVERYVGDGSELAASSEADVGSSSKGDAPASSPATSSAVENTTSTKRGLEHEKHHDGAGKVPDEPALKKPRNVESDAKQQKTYTMAVEAPSAAAVEESQDEPMLPVRPTSARAKSAGEEEQLAASSSTAAVATSEASKIDTATGATVSSGVPKQDQGKIPVEESQTQVEPLATRDVSIAEEGSDSSLTVKERINDEVPAAVHKQVERSAQHDAATATVSGAEKDSAEDNPPKQTKQQPAIVMKPSEELQEQSASKGQQASDAKDHTRTGVQVNIATEVKAQVTPSFTPAFGDNVVKSPAAVSEDQNGNKEKMESTAGNSESVKEVAGPLIFQQTSSEAQGTEEERGEPGEIKADISARFERLATPPVERVAVTADLKVAAAPKKEEVEGDAKQEASGNGVVSPGRDDRGASAEQGPTADSSRDVVEQAQKEMTEHVDESAQSKVKEPAHQDSHQDAPTTSSTAPQKQKRKATETEIADSSNTKPDQTEVAAIKPTSTDENKSESNALPNDGAEMTFEDLIVGGATTAPIGLDDEAAK